MRVHLTSGLFFLLACHCLSAAQTPELKFIADTLVVQADGTYEADPDLATMTFHIFAQDKELKKAYDEASDSMRKISALAVNNGLKVQDVSAGALTVAPIYSGDRKKQARSYYVQGEMVLRVRDFSHIGAILDGSVDAGLADFRSLTYSLSNEEAAKKQAVAEAMRRAIGRASIALEQKGQKLGGLRYMNLDVQQPMGFTVAQLQSMPVMTEMAELSSGNGGLFSKKAAPPPPPPPPPQPEKITVRATVQCAFQIQ
jgi:uncharacterized protein YggE